jgi:hypothetical protein
MPADDEMTNLFAAREDEPLLPGCIAFPFNDLTAIE